MGTRCGWCSAHCRASAQSEHALAFAWSRGKLAALQAWFHKHHGKVRLALAVIAGLLLAASFPRSSIAGLAWIAPGVLLFAALGTSGKRPFAIGYCGGLAFALPTLYWLLHMPVGWEKILGWLALCAYLALYCGVWVWLCWRLFPGDLSPPLASPPPARDENETTRPRVSTLAPRNETSRREIAVLHWRP